MYLLTLYRIQMAAILVQKTQSVTARIGLLILKGYTFVEPTP